MTQRPATSHAVQVLLAPVALALVLSGCSPAGQVASSEPASSEPASSEPASSEPASSEPASSEPASSEPASSEPASPGRAGVAAAGVERLFTPSDGAPRRALLTIPALDIVNLPVVPYQGWTDDAPGTRIQDRGVAASPHGQRGGVGPGGVGNYQVTAHRTSATRAFEFLPDLRRGDRVRVEWGGTRYVYEVRRTRETSFRSTRSLREQRAAVPGRPGATPKRAFITLSTCATQEDHAVGNYWSDEFHNPEHRIDKIGVLVRTVPVD